MLKVPIDIRGRLENEQKQKQYLTNIFKTVINKHTKDPSNTRGWFTKLHNSFVSSVYLNTDKKIYLESYPPGHSLIEKKTILKQVLAEAKTKAKDSKFIGPKEHKDVLAERVVSEVLTKAKNKKLQQELVPKKTKAPTLSTSQKVPKH